MTLTLEENINLSQEELKVADEKIGFKNKKSAIKLLERSRYHLNKAREILEHKAYKIDEEIIERYDFNEMCYTLLLDTLLNLYPKNKK